MTRDARTPARPGCLAAPARLVSWLAFLSVAGAWVIQDTVGERTWLTTVVTYAPPLLFLAAPTLGALLGLLARERRAALVGLIGLALALATVARPGLHPRRSPTRTMDSIRVVTWNVHNRTGALPTIVEELRRLSPDVVCLQEAYDQRFRDLLPGVECVKRGELVTLSRLEILGWRRVATRPVGQGAHTFLETRLALPRGELRVLNVHLYSYQPQSRVQPWSARERRHAEEALVIRRREAEQLTEWLGDTAGPRVVAGDFNTPPRGSIYRGLTHRLTDAFAASGSGFGWSFPSGFPLWRIDYVWSSRELTPLDCRTLALPPSDHHPVVADLRIR